MRNWKDVIAGVEQLHAQRPGSVVRLEDGRAAAAVDVIGEQSVLVVARGERDVLALQHVTDALPINAMIDRLRTTKAPP